MDLILRVKLSLFNDSDTTRSRSVSLMLGHLPFGQKKNDVANGVFHRVFSLLPLSKIGIFSCFETAMHQSVLHHRFKFLAIFGVEFIGIFGYTIVVGGMQHDEYCADFRSEELQ